MKETGEKESDVERNRERQIERKVKGCERMGKRREEEMKYILCIVQNITNI